MVNVKLHTVFLAAGNCSRLNLVLLSLQGELLFPLLRCGSGISTGDLGRVCCTGNSGFSSLALSFPRFTPPTSSASLIALGSSLCFLLPERQWVFYCLSPISCCTVAVPMWGTFSKKREIFQCQLLCTHFESSPKSLCLGSVFKSL